MGLLGAFRPGNAGTPEIRNMRKILTRCNRAGGQTVSAPPFSTPMYGYSYPKHHDASRVRIFVCESQLCHYLREFPQLERAQILQIMRDKGPLRAPVEEALRRAAGRTSA